MKFVKRRNEKDEDERIDSLGESAMEYWQRTRVF
jgi:hypothetical protein